MRHNYLLTFLLFLLAAPAFAQSLQTSFQTNATAALIVDQTHGATLFQKNADTPIPPASMSKLMTLNMLFEALAAGSITLQTEFTVSERAHAIGGSSMFLRIGERVSVQNLILGIIVQSGNDACIAVAEGLAGSEDAFARQMTARAAELGMTGSVFANSTGWPAPTHKMSARDLVFLAARLMNEFPEYYPYFAQTEFTWDNIKQRNRNPLLGLGIGADGLKTGYTEESGYSLIGSVLAGDRRILFVVAGLGSQAERKAEAMRVTNWALDNFRTRAVFNAGDVLGRADVWLGAADTVGLYTREPIKVLLPNNAGKTLNAEVRFNNPLPAPIAKDAEIGQLVISPAGLGERSYPLYAGEAVERSGAWRLGMQKLRILFARILNQELYPER